MIYVTACSCAHFTVHTKVLTRLSFVITDYSLRFEDLVLDFKLKMLQPIQSYSIFKTILQYFKCSTYYEFHIFLITRNNFLNWQEIKLTGIRKLTVWLHLKHWLLYLFLMVYVSKTKETSFVSWHFFLAWYYRFLLDILMSCYELSTLEYSSILRSYLF